MCSTSVLPTTKRLSEGNKGDESTEGHEGNEKVISSDSATGIAWAVDGAQVCSSDIAGKAFLQVRRACSKLYSQGCWMPLYTWK